MSKHIVFERTGEVRAPKEGEMVINPQGIVGHARGEWITPCPILRRLPDAEVEAAEAQLAEANTAFARGREIGLAEAVAIILDRDPESPFPTYYDVHDGEPTVMRWDVGALEKIFGVNGCSAFDDLTAKCARQEAAIGKMLAKLVQQKARAEKAEAERDELRAKVKEDADALRRTRDALCEARNERDRAQSEAQAHAEIAKSFVEGRAVEIEDDTRARFERETAARLLPMIWNSYEGKDSGWQQSAVGEAVTMARMLAESTFGPAQPEAAPVTSTPTPSPANATVYGPKACNPAPADPAPTKEPWTPMVGDTVRIVASTVLPNDKKRALIGAIGTVQIPDSNSSICVVLGWIFAFADLELVRRAEDVK